jgi:type II secretory pathway component PulF
MKKSSINAIPKNSAKYKLFSTFGLGKERDYFVENLSMLISGGMPIIDALDSIAEELRSRRMKKIIYDMQSDISSGSPLWRTLQNTNIFPEHAVSLIRLGEESGKLTENLKVVAIEQEKERVFKSKLRSAMMYPVFVLSLTVIIGIGIAWFILPKLAIVFAQLKITLPLITKILIGAGIFLGNYGQYAVPGAILIVVVLFFFIFSFSRTKFIGQSILFFAPGIKVLIKEVEVARFGYLLGTLLEAGLPITSALDSLAGATDIEQYRKLYIHLRNSVEEGNSLQKSFATFSPKNKLVSNGKYANHLIPSPIQQLIVAGERSGTLSLTLLKIGQMYESKADTSTKNLTVILEPILLVIVWLGVVAVALAVILPIYSLIGGFKT